MYTFTMLKSGVRPWSHQVWTYTPVTWTLNRWRQEEESGFLGHSQLHRKLFGQRGPSTQRGKKGSWIPKGLEHMPDTQSPKPSLGYATPPHWQEIVVWFCWGKVSLYSANWHRNHHLVQADPLLMTMLLQSPSTKIVGVYYHPMLKERFQKKVLYGAFNRHAEPPFH